MRIKVSTLDYIIHKHYKPCSIWITIWMRWEAVLWIWVYTGLDLPHFRQVNVRRNITFMSNGKATGWMRTIWSTLQATLVLNIWSRKVRFIKSARWLTLPSIWECKVFWLYNQSSASHSAKICSTYNLITTPTKLWTLNPETATSTLFLCMALWSISLLMPLMLKNPLSEWKNIFLVNQLTVRKLIKYRISWVWVKPYRNLSMWFMNLNKMFFLWKTTLHLEVKSKRNSILKLENPLFPAIIRIRLNQLLSHLYLL